MTKQLYIKVEGLVQGVFFRAETQKEARTLGLTGWAKNMEDGSVEILAQGEELSLREFREWCKKGPDFARVDKVITTWQPLRDNFVDFEVK